MVLIVDEFSLKKKLGQFLRREFEGKVERNIKILDHFNADYLITKSNKKIIVIFRNPPEYPLKLEDEITSCLSKGYIIYIASSVGDDLVSKELLDDLVEECISRGMGVIKCEGNKNFKRIKKAKQDSPVERIDSTLISFFISSKLSIEERDIAHDLVKRMGHQPICVEKINLNGNVWEKCKEWMDTSKFFIGIVTSEHRPLVEKEIKYFLQKYHRRCLILIKNSHDIKGIKYKKTEDLINNIIKPKTTFVDYNSLSDLKNEIRRRLPRLISSNIP